MTAQNPMFVRSQKEVGITYILWLLLGTLGVHRFYLGFNSSAAVMLVLTVLGWITAVLLVGFVLLAVVWVWVIADAFLIPGLVRTANGQ